MIGNDDSLRGAPVPANAASGPDRAPERERVLPQPVVIEFAPSMVQSMQEIRHMSDAKSHADLVTDALRLFDWFLRQRAQGWRLQLVRGDVVREVEVSFR